MKNLTTTLYLLIIFLTFFSCQRAKEVETIVEENIKAKEEQAGKKLIVGEWQWHSSKGSGTGIIYADSVDYNMTISVKEKGEVSLRVNKIEGTTIEKMSYRYREKFQSFFIFDVYLVENNFYYGELRINETQSDEISLDFRGHAILYFKK